MELIKKRRSDTWHLAREIKLDARFYDTSKVYSAAYCLCETPIINPVIYSGFKDQRFPITADEELHTFCSHCFRATPKALAARALLRKQYTDNHMKPCFVPWRN